MKVSAATALSKRFEAIKMLFGSRNCLLVAVAVSAVVLWFNGHVLASAGVPLLFLALLPCLAMCALGMCKKGGNGKPVARKEVALAAAKLALN